MHPQAKMREGIGRHPNSYFDASMYAKMYAQSNKEAKENDANKQAEVGKTPEKIHTNTNQAGGVNGGSLNNLSSVAN